MDFDFLNGEDKYTQFFLINKVGQEYEEKGQIDEAIEVYEKGLSLGTDTPATWNLLFNIYRERKDIKNMKRVMNYAFKKEKGNQYREKNLERKKQAIDKIKAETKA